MEKQNRFNKKQIFFVVLLIVTTNLFYHAKTIFEKADNYSFAKPKDSLPFFMGKDLEPQWTKEAQKDFRKISDFEMIDQMNQMIKSDSLKNQITIVSFFFTKCAGICPTITNQLRRVQSSIEKEKKIKILSFSATPDLDSPEVLAKYAEERKIDSSKWKLLTGNKDSIYKLARESFNADTITKGEKLKGRTENDFLHSENIYLLDQNLYLRGIYNGKDALSVNDLIEDIKVLKQK